jgi:hypothetical protein
MTATRTRPTLLALGGLLAVGLTIGFAIHIGGWTIGRVHHDEHRVLSGPISSLQVDAGTGDVNIVAGRGRDVTIDSRAEGTFHVPELRVNVEGSHVSLSGGCDVVGLGPCQATVVLHVPADVPVKVDGHSGDLTASGMSAPVKLHTSSGNVSADGLTGEADLRTGSGDVSAGALTGTVKLRSSSGDVSAVDLDARRVLASTNSGDVKLVFTAAPDRVDALGHSGDMTVVVAPGSGPYHVVADTNSGDTNTIPDTARATRLIHARTNSGDVVVGY